MIRWLESVYLRGLIAAEWIKEQAYVLLWLIGGIYWRAWQAYDRAKYHKNVRQDISKHQQNKQVAKTPTAPSPQTYSIILTAKGEKMLEDIASAHKLYYNKDHSKAHWIAAIINNHIGKEHEKALELKKQAVKRRRDGFRVVQ